MQRQRRQADAKAERKPVKAAARQRSEEGRAVRGCRGRPAATAPRRAGSELPLSSDFRRECCNRKVCRVFTVAGRPLQGPTRRRRRETSATAPVASRLVVVPVPAARRDVGDERRSSNGVALGRAAVAVADVLTLRRRRLVARLADAAVNSSFASPSRIALARVRRAAPRATPPRTGCLLDLVAGDEARLRPSMSRVQRDVPRARRRSPTFQSVRSGPARRRSEKVDVGGLSVHRGDTAPATPRQRCLSWERRRTGLARPRGASHRA